MNSADFRIVYLRKEIARILKNSNRFIINDITLAEDASSVVVQMQLPLEVDHPHSTVAVEIHLPNDFPHHPPRSIRVLDQLKHPYIDSDSRLMAQLFETENWTPIFSLEDIVDRIYVALAEALLN